jgi:hypothetical protein
MIVTEQLTEFLGWKIIPARLEDMDSAALTYAEVKAIASVVQGFEERAARLEADIKDSQKRATALEAKVGSPFEKEERYHQLVKRQSEIEEKLDLTKNQAPSQVDAAANEEREENSVKQTETKSIQHSRQAAVRI